MKRPTVFLASALVLTVALAGGATFGLRRAEPLARLRCAPVVRADLVATIAASGTLVPEDVVDVGAQVNGQIAAFGTDADGAPVDFRSRVTQGMVLARIDSSLYEADVATAEAALAQARAEVQVAQATRDQAQARLEQAQHDWERAQALGDSLALSRAEVEAARTAFDAARAARAVTEATIAQGAAAVQSAEASGTRARRNLDYCTIHSPVDGVILDRRVEIGQTVVASLNAPSLFLIAKDLGRMTVLVQVNEADIAHVQPGMEVSFSVDAHPGSTYRGTVRKVRLNATLTQNVVTYTVEIAADNPRLELLPYLTANVVFELERHAGVLAVPNAALRWSPRAGGESPAEPREIGTEERPLARGSSVWIVKDGAPLAVPVRTGLGDGTRTEIEGDGIAEGVQVILGERAEGAAGPPRSAGSEGANPFAPQMLRGRAR